MTDWNDPRKRIVFTCLLLSSVVMLASGVHHDQNDRKYEQEIYNLNREMIRLSGENASLKATHSQDLFNLQRCYDRLSYSPYGR